MGKDIIRFHCVYWPAMLLSAGIEPPWACTCTVCFSSPARRWRRRSSQPDHAGRSRRRVRGRRLPLPLPRRRAVRSRRRLQLRGHGGSLQLRSRQQPRQSADPRRHRRRVASATVSVPRPARQPPRRLGRGEAYTRPPKRLGSCPTDRRPRGHLATHPGDQRRARGAPSPGRPSPVRRSTGSSATRSRCYASWPCSPRPRSRHAAEEIWDRIGLSAVRSADQRLPAGRGLGRLPGRPAGREGRAALPGRAVLGPGSTTTATSTTSVSPMARPWRSRGARAAGVGGIITIGTDAMRSRMAIEIAARHDDVWATVGLHPHDASHGVDTIVALLDAARRWWPSGSAGSTTTTTTRHGRSSAPRSPSRSPLAHARDLTLVIHTREAWDETFVDPRHRGCARRTVFHCFTGGPTRLGAASTSGRSCRSAASSRSQGRRRAHGRAERCPIDRLLVETDSPVPGPGAPSRHAERAGVCAAGGCCRCAGQGRRRPARRGGLDADRGRGVRPALTSPRLVSRGGWSSGGLTGRAASHRCRGPRHADRPCCGRRRPSRRPEQ